MKIIAFESKLNENRSITVSNSLGDTITTKKLHKIIDFLYLSIDDTKNTARVAWNIDIFVAPILSLLIEEELIRLHEKKRFYLAPYRISYVKEKVFSISYSGSKNYMTISYYGLSQYLLDIEETPDLLDSQYYADQLNDALKEMEMQTTKLASPIKIYEDCMLKNMLLPKKDDIPQMALELSHKCAGRLWIEAFKLGYFEKIYDYDISSAFPTAAMDLVDIRYGEWKETNLIPYDAIYGYAEVEVNIRKEIKVHPIMKRYYEKAEEVWHTPTGRWPTELTLNQIKFIYAYNLGTAFIKHAIWFKPYSKSTPLLIPMKKILRWKKSDNVIIKDIAKRQSTGIYGKFLERKGEGPYYNPVYGAEISTNPTLALAGIIYKHNAMDNLICVKVDGFMTDKELN